MSTKSQHTRQVVRVQAKIVWRVFIDKPTGYWIGVCDPLSVTAEGETYKDLIQAINEINAVVFGIALKENSLDKFLRDRGWDLLTPLPPRNARAGVEFDIPYELKQLRAAPVLA